MSMKNLKKSNNLSVEQVREKIDEYKGTIHAIQAFISLVTWDNQNLQIRSNANISLGRRMDTSPNNLISPNNIVTPDTVIQLENGLGYTVEAKYSLPNNQDHWVDDINQFIKYDDDLRGWWTNNELIPLQCNILLIENARSVRFVEFLQAWLLEQNISFNSHAAIIEFQKSDNAKPFYFIRKMPWGSILPDELSDVLKYGKKISIEKVVGTYGTKKFYDSAPPVVDYTMAIIWQDILNPDAVNGQYSKSLGGIPIYVRLDDLTIELQKLYGQDGNSSRDVQFPQKDWIRLAMEEFVKIGVARRLENDPNAYNYLVIFRQIKKDIFEFFVESRNKSNNKDTKGKQLDLFTSGEDSPKSDQSEN